MKTAKQVEIRIDQLETKIERLEKIVNAPQQTPGPFITGRTERVYARLSPAEKAELGKELERRGLSLSDWIVAMLPASKTEGS